MMNEKIEILIAEDDYLSRDLINQVLKLNDELVLYIAEDGEKALDLLFRKELDLIILSANLPQKSGFEVLKIIQRGRKFSSIPTIVLISNSGERIKALNLGANIFLEKPYNIAELKLKVFNQIKLIECLKKKMIKKLQTKVCEIEIEKAQREILLKLAMQNEKQMLFHDDFKAIKTATYTRELAKLCSDIPKHLLQNIYYAASFHNIGFISLPNNKLKKQNGASNNICN